MSDNNCERNGHLWGPEGNCVMCKAEKPDDNKDNAPSGRIDILEVCFYSNGKIKVGGNKYILKSTADDDKSDIIRINNELSNDVSDLEYKLEDKRRELEEILKPIRELLLKEYFCYDSERYKLYRAIEAIKETLDLADKAGGK